jgi:DNA invertase Pin-like site-specific DNA recombinase
MARVQALYVRVSTVEQIGGAESQTRALLQYCERNGISEYEVFTDHGVSGAKESRPALNRLMQKVEDGEISEVVVFSFSRFARSTSHLLKGLQKFKEKNVKFVSVTESINTDTPLGVAFLTILGCLAQLERELIIERVRAGLANARAKGKLIGRKKMRDSDLIRKLLKSGLSFRQVSSIAKCSHGSVSAEKKQMVAEESIAKAAEDKAKEKQQAAAVQKVEERIDLLRKYEPIPSAPREVQLSDAGADEMTIEK